MNWKPIIAGLVLIFILGNCAVAAQNAPGTPIAPNATQSMGATAMLQDAGGKVLMQGGWSASKSEQSWNGAWRATVSGRAGEYSGTWTSTTSLSPRAHLAEMLESALRAVVSGTWKSGRRSGSWSIRASP